MRDRVIHVRKANGLSQKAFADKIGLSRNFISLYENGNRELSDRTIKDICDAFGVNEEWLKTGDGPMNRPEPQEDEIGKMVNELFHMKQNSFRYQLAKLIMEAPDNVLQYMQDAARSALEQCEEKTEE